MEAWSVNHEDIIYYILYFVKCFYRSFTKIVTFQPIIVFIPRFYCDNAEFYETFPAVIHYKSIS